MPSAEARTLLLRGLVLVALGGVAAATSCIYRTELTSELERTAIQESNIAPANQRSAISPPPGASDPLATRNLAKATTSAREVRLVVSSDGSPVSRYNLTVDRGKRSSDTVLRARIDESDGHPGVIALRPGNYALHVVADVGGAALEFEVKNGSNEPIHVSLARFGALRGSIVDARSRRPIQAELEFLVIPKDARTGRRLTSFYLSSMKRTIKTDENGEFTLHKIEPGHVGIQLRDRVTERPIWIMQSDESGTLTRGSGYLGELSPGQDLDLGVVRGKLGYDYYR
jgi:hypothetical protein